VEHGEKEVPFDLIVLRDPHPSRKLRLDPDSSAIVAGAGPFVDGAKLRDHRVEDPESLGVLDRPITATHDAERLPGVHPNDRTSLGNQARGLRRRDLGKDRREADLPIKSVGTDRLCGGHRMIL
jgi:hypothetical protein